VSLRNLNGNAQRCWAHLDDLRCEKAPGHASEHACAGTYWVDHGLGPTLDVSLDDYRGGAA
jgi:hypothetical protein